MEKKGSFRVKIIVAFALFYVFIVACAVGIGLYGYNKGIYEMVYIVGGAIVGGLLFDLVVLRYILGQVSLPLRKIRDVLGKIAEGDVDVTCEIDTMDEFGEIMRDINRVVAQIKQQAELAKKIAAGDMTVSVTPRSDRDVLSNAFIELLDGNNAILSNIKESTNQVSAGSGQVADASNALAQGSTEQASAIEQVKSAMNDIANKTKENAEQATKVDAIASNVNEAAVTEKAKMAELMNAMNKINDSSDKIAKVIKVIDDIAFQTNILALNATVEAARAGVHGKGFAVVAEEVRNLAEKSAAAAKETSDMIEDSISGIKRGTELTTQTQKDLEQVLVALEEIAGLINGIAKSSNEQATAIAQIDLAINQVSDVVQTNSATSEQCASASEELSNQAENLKNMIGNFKLKEYAYRGDSLGGFSNSSYTETDNEQIISLDGGFGKY